jgi:hypothetical protein
MRNNALPCSLVQIYWRCRGICYIVTRDCCGKFLTCHHIPVHNTLHGYLLTPSSRVLLEKLTSSQPVKKLPHFMEPEGSLPHSQVPTTCPCPELDQSSPCPQPHFLKIHLNIILPSMPGPLKWSLSLRFPHQNLVYTSPLLHMHYMPCPSHSPRSDHPNNIWWEIQIIKLLLM